MMRLSDRSQDASPPAAAWRAPRAGHRSAGARWPGRAWLGELGAGCRELRSKLVAYYLVRVRAQRRAARGASDLGALVADTCRSDPRHAAFLLERLCYDFVRGRWREAGEPRDLLRGAAAGRLPERSLILLHAGLGMALADVLLRPLRPGNPEAAFDAALDRFTGLVAANAQPDFAAVSCEALGLMVRRFMPRVHGAVEARLRARDARLAAFYWHGAGRAIYFLPALFHPFPGVAQRAVEICRREPPSPGHRLDALAGLGFAATMINLSHPEVVARLLPHLEPGEVAALASGVAGALLTRRHTSPDDLSVGAFLRPLAIDGAGTAELWEREVRGPCAEALDRAYPVLCARGELAILARHRPVGTLLAARWEEG